ncbi:hypothetical protein HMI54_001674 [Coelomomyces lativittatus]|nr:hypothetical protein HMI56_006713 [Coelomomyces lativittatus]KAJ1510316.1 hypothetical protein HMI54_001674 [Coelomomyces lativittatus]KAJ1513142.1 hypothetical protein HMI55_005869 [Coelomomyces lativittatus]
MMRQISLNYKDSINTKRVICTGSFDDWKAQREMKLGLTYKDKLFPHLSYKQFHIKIDVPNEQKEIIFKFIVDGSWCTSSEYEKTGSGYFENNILQLEPIKGTELRSEKTEQMDSSSSSSSEIIDEEMEKTLRFSKNTFESQDATAFNNPLKNKNLVDSGNSMHYKKWNEDPTIDTSKQKTCQDDIGFFRKIVLFFSNCLKGRTDSSQKTK